MIFLEIESDIFLNALFLLNKWSIIDYYYYLFVFIKLCFL